MTDNAPKPASELILYQTEDGRTRIECRFEGETLWLTQAQIAELFQKDVRTINEHLTNIFDEGELGREATIRKLRMVRTEGKREVTREIEHYSLDAVLAVGFRVRSQRGTQFRQWATARLSEYLVKGFTMDDERLKYPPGPGRRDYFDELLERIREIRASERRFYQKVLDIYATSVDYRPDAEVSQRFFATVQNKVHWASHGHTAAEVIHARADATKPFMGMQSTRPGGLVRKEDAAIAKNYLTEPELQVLSPSRPCRTVPPRRAGGDPLAQLPAGRTLVHRRAHAWKPTRRGSALRDETKCTRHNRNAAGLYRGASESGAVRRATEEGARLAGRNRYSGRSHTRD